VTDELNVNPEYPTDIPYRRVLDHGFVALVDAMGNDASIVQAARVSYGKGTKKVSTDKALIAYLRRHDHTTPFEMVEFKFLMRLPVFVARQIIRHRMVSVNEYSARYSLVPDRFWVPALGAIAEQDNVNRQGRADALRELVGALPERTRPRVPCAFLEGEPAVLVAPDAKGISRRALLDPRARDAFVASWSEGKAAPGMLPTESYVYWVEQLLCFFPERRARLEAVRAAYDEQNRRSYALYERLLAEGIAREIARCVLPLSMYTEWYWKVDLHNLLHFLRLRMDAHAQLEVRAFAEAIATFVKERCPFTWEAFEAEVLQGARISGPERAVLRPKEVEEQKRVLRALYDAGYRERRLKETCRKLDIDERLVDELWPPRQP
jgi:thymidylate synthase ThyX